MALIVLWVVRRGCCCCCCHCCRLVDGRSCEVGAVGVDPVVVLYDIGIIDCAIVNVVANAGAYAAAVCIN